MKDLNIRTSDKKIVPVKVKNLTGAYGMKVFIHRDYDNPIYWAISECLTGLNCARNCKTQKEAWDKFVKSASFNPDNNQPMIKELWIKLGAANPEYQYPFTNNQ